MARNISDRIANSFLGDEPKPRANFMGAEAKLTIGSVDDTSLSVVAQYNPREVQISQPTSWAEHKSTNKQIGSTRLEYTGAAPRTMQIELLFDGYETGGKLGSGGTIMDTIKQLEQLASPRDPESSNDHMRRPHFCLVAWGGDARPVDCMATFRCVIESLTTKYQMFSSKGTVLRATCTLNLKEADRVDLLDALREAALGWFR